MQRVAWIALLILLIAVPAFADQGAPMGPGLYEAPLICGQDEEAGTVSVWNTLRDLHVEVRMHPGWELVAYELYVGNVPVPVNRGGNPVPGRFTYKYEYDKRSQEAPLTFFAKDIHLEQELDFKWGRPWDDQRVKYLAFHGSVQKRAADGTMEYAGGAWWLGKEYEGAQWGWWVDYELTHPEQAHFIDSPVHGLTVFSPTYRGQATDASGAWPYFPGESAGFWVGPVYLGEARADHKVSPLDLFPSSDLDDPRIANMAMFLQSLDADAEPKQGITITSDVVACLEQALVDTGHQAVNWTWDEQVDAIVDATIDRCSFLVKVSREDAVENLDRSVNASMFRKNISRTPELASSKSKLNVMGVWFPAFKANGDPAVYTDEAGVEREGIAYYDEDGLFIRDTTEAKPLVITYTDADPDTGAPDVWAAISRDDGHTWKRKNLSRAAYRSSYTLASGSEYWGEAKKPVFQVKGNKMLVAWTSKYCRGGRPGYAIQVCPDDDGDGVPDPCTVCTGYGDNEVCELDYIYDDPYWQDDIWGVAGPQRSHDYTEDGYPEVGEVPYSCVWVARGVVATQGDVNKGLGEYPGDIVWFKPERLTSGRRDANQVFMGASDGAGFAIAWQEDPGGLRPGEAKGPGPGWGGATTNHKTDIWYSYITWADFAKVDTHFEPGGDPQHDDPDLVGRPKALVPMSLPVRVSDNDVVNTHNMWIELDEATGLPIRDADGNFIPIPNPDTNSDEADGSHRYGYMLEGLWEWDGTLYHEGDVVDWQEGDGGTLFEFVNQQGETKRVVVTADGRPLDGNTGASRPNLFLQTYTRPDGSKSAWAIMAYEETKGMGSGPPDDNGTGEQPQDGSGYDPYDMVPDEGKNAIYHSFDFTQPDLVSAGTILNLPETDEYGDPLYVAEVDCLGSIRDENGDPIFDGDGNYQCNPNPLAGELILDWKGDAQLAYENARRPRFILQSKSAAFGGTRPDGSFKNPENSGTVLLVLYKEGQEGQGRPSDIMVRRCVVRTPDGTIKKGNPYSPSNFRPGAQNVSTVTPTETWINPDRDPNAKGDGVKVCRWEQTEADLSQKSSVNPYEDARAHRGAIRGDFVVMGYSYTPNWAASRNAHDKYDFYIRRSFDGGATWTTDPAATEPVVHTDFFFNPDGISGAELDEEGNDISEPTKHYTVETIYGPGEWEPARNVSLLKNNKTSVIEPRLVAVPGTIKIDGEWTGIPEDKQNPDVFYVAYGTSTNLPFVEKAPEDLFLSFSQDRGTTLVLDTWVVNPDSDGNHAGETVDDWLRLAKGDPEQGEVQLRMTPDGSRFYASWLEEGEDGSDIMFRRLMPSEFPSNVSPDAPTE